MIIATFIEVFAIRTFTQSAAPIRVIVATNTTVHTAIISILFSAHKCHDYRLLSCIVPASNLSLHHL